MPHICTPPSSNSPRVHQKPLQKPVHIQAWKAGALLRGSCVEVAHDASSSPMRSAFLSRFALAWILACSCCSCSHEGMRDPYSNKHAPSAAVAVEARAREVSSAHTAKAASHSGDGFPVSDECITQGCSTTDGCHADAAAEAATLAHIASRLLSLPELQTTPPPQCCDQVRSVPPCVGTNRRAHLFAWPFPRGKRCLGLRACPHTRPGFRGNQLRQEDKTRQDKTRQAVARLDLDVSTWWASPSSRGLWGGDALLHSTGAAETETPTGGERGSSTDLHHDNVSARRVTAGCMRCPSSRAGSSVSPPPRAPICTTCHPTRGCPRAARPPPLPPHTWPL
jgi:hypothetical protein